MGRRREKSAKLDPEYDEGGSEPSKAIILFSDSDDDAANEDLSLRIVAKAISRASSGAAHRIGSGFNECDAGSLSVPADGDRGAEDIVTTGLVAVEKSAKKKKIKKERWRKKKPSVVTEVPMDDAVEDGQKTSETVEVEDLSKIPEQGAAENNAVLKRLLRGPRYFDPPDSNWGACFNCGEAGHSAVNCTVARRKKPCFVCGSFEHGAKQCKKGRDCFICKEGGHQAKDCPIKYKKGVSQGSDLCLKCGSSGHDMFFCSSDYSPDDLKDIQCYVCKRYGHLCCVNYSSAVSTDELSCYKCGQPGHTGLACSRGSRRETTGAGSSPSSCFKCGVEGHFARECTNSTPTSSCYVCGTEGHLARECTSSTKVKKRGRDLSTPRKKPSHQEDKGYKSAPQDRGRGLKKKKLYNEEEWSKTRSSSKRKPRGGWIVDDPGDYYTHERSYNIPNDWRSPSTPTGRNYRIPNHSDNSPYSNPWWSRMENGNSYDRSQNSLGQSYSYHNRYSASRFGNSSNNSGMRRNHEWW